MPSLLDLPNEVIAKTFVHLNPDDIGNCRSVCKALQRISSDDQVLRTICQRMGYLQLGERLEDRRKALCDNGEHYLPGSIKSDRTVDGRKKIEYSNYVRYLHSSFSLDEIKSNGDLSFKGGSHWHVAPPTPWRIKIDHLNDCLISTTTNFPGIEIRGMAPKSDLNLHHDPINIQPYTHLEASHGWVVHSVSGRAFQIWKNERSTFASDFDDGDSDSDNDEGQHRAGFCGLLDKGQIAAKHTARAYRLIFPVLAVASREGFVTLYDIVSKEAILDVTLDTSAASSFDIGYVEFDDEFVWVIVHLNLGFHFSSEVHAYARSTGKLVWRLGLDSDLTTRKEAAVFIASDDGQGSSSFEPAHLRRVARPRKDTFDLTSAEWTALHPDHRTRSLCLSAGDSLLVIPDYANFHGQGGHRRIISFVNYGDSRPPSGLPLSPVQRGESHYLAVADGRAAYLCQDQVAMVDLTAALSLADELQSNSEQGPPEQDPDSDRWRAALQSTLVYYRPCMELGFDTAHSSCLALTATHMAMVGDFNLDTEQGTGESGSAVGQSQAATGPRFVRKQGVAWINFGAMRSKQKDTERGAEDRKKIEMIAHLENRQEVGRAPHAGQAVEMEDEEDSEEDEWVSDDEADEMSDIEGDQGAGSELEIAEDDSLDDDE
ncbi:unnamed protein product [Sympodiomycopsis kandeliae]